MGQDRTIDTKLEDHAMFQDDINPEAELMAEEEPEWQDDEGEEVEPFPEEPDYEYYTPPEHQGRLPAIVGALLLALGCIHAVIIVVAPQSLAGFATSLANLGLSPAHPMLAGLVFWVMSRQRKQQPLDTTDLEDQLRSQFDDFVTRIPSSDGAGAGLEDVDRILMALQRQDEKINNLTRATKMYGKPMVEITTQVSETTNQIKDLDSAINELREQMGKINEPLIKGINQIGSMLEKLPTLGSSDLKSGMESFSEKLGQSIEASMDESKKHLAESIEKLLNHAEKSSSAELEQSLESIQRELSGIATGLDQIMNRPAASPREATSTKATTPNPAPTPASAAKSTPPGGLAHSISGPRKATGKNVLGAIAKLKNMRK